MNRCRSCNAEIFFAQTVAGAQMPLDAAEAAVGTAGALVVIYGASDRAFAYQPAELAERIATRRGFSLQHATDMIASDYPWHLSHFATCKYAAAHRRPR